MALWTIGALIVLNSVFTIEKDAKSSTLDINSMDVYQQAMIPLLYPSQLLNFDPFKILEDIEVAILPKPEPKKIIEKLALALPPPRKSAHTRFDSIINTAAARYFALQGPDGKRFENIQNPEKNKSHRNRYKGERQACQRDQHAGYFIYDNTAGVFAADHFFT